MRGGVVELRSPKLQVPLLMTKRQVRCYLVPMGMGAIMGMRTESTTAAAAVRGPARRVATAGVGGRTRGKDRAGGHGGMAIMIPPATKTHGLGSRPRWDCPRAAAAGSSGAIISHGGREASVVHAVSTNALFGSTTLSLLASENQRDGSDTLFYIGQRLKTRDTANDNETRSR